MGSDASFSYIHFPTQESVLFVESWENQKLRWNDVDFPNAEDIDHYGNLLEQFLSQSNEEETEYTLNPASNPILSSSYATRMKQKSRKLNWKDVDIDAFQTHSHSLKRLHRAQHIHDETILKKPNFGRLSGDADLDSALGLNKVSIDNSTNDLLGDVGELHESSINWDTDNDVHGDTNVGNDNAMPHSRSILNPDTSRSFTQQFTTPIVGNRVYMPNFQGSAHRAVSQQRRQTSDHSVRNPSYHSPRRDNIR